MTSTDPDHAVRVIRARCGDALTPAEIDAVESALAGCDPDAIPGDIAERIIDVLAAMESRLAAMEAA